MASIAARWIPAASEEEGSCVACLHLGEPSCRFFNSKLNRAVLTGDDGGYLNFLDVSSGATSSYARGLVTQFARRGTMTIAVSWTRRLKGGGEELVFVADSRYSGDGRNFDACPKILTLPRSDSAISFSGYTGHALPMMLQLIQGITSYDQALRRSQDITQLKTHAMKVFDTMSKAIVSSKYLSKPDDTRPYATFLFGGYSGRSKQFELWTIFYQPAQKSFEARPAPWLHYSLGENKFRFRAVPKGSGLTPLGRIAFAGDRAKEAQAKLLEKVTSSKSKIERLNWEPFEVIRDMLRDKNAAETIGGPPQVVKVYQYFQADPLGVYWPSKTHGYPTLQGRKCLPYEKLDRWILDPDTLQTERWPASRGAQANSVFKETE
jgi:hypothetical protein